MKISKPIAPVQSKNPAEMQASREQRPKIAGLMVAVLLVLVGPSALARGFVDLAFDKDDSRSRCMPGRSNGTVYEQILIDEVFPVVIDRTPGRDFGARQLFEPIRKIGRPLGEIGSRCVAGDSASCIEFSRWLDLLAERDALRFDRAKHRAISISFVTGTLSGNLTLRPIAIYYGILKSKGLVELSDVNGFERWLMQRAQDYEDAPSSLQPRHAQNHVLNTRLTQLAVGLAVGNSTYEHKAAEIYKLYLDTMRDDGSFPQEAKRGPSALKYTNMAIGELVLLAELMSLAGYDLYSYQSSSGDIHRAIEFLMRSIEDESLIEKYAVENFAPTDQMPHSGRQSRDFLRDQLGWTVPYSSRFPNSTNIARIKAVLKSIKRPMPTYFDENIGVIGTCVWSPRALSTE